MEINDKNNNNNESLISSFNFNSNQDENVQGFPGFSASPAKRSIAERRAAKCGFNSDATRINTARFRTTSPFASPAPRSPCLTIPPGISPTALLDSPIMLPNSQAMPSPTTGTFLLPLSHEGSILTSVTLEDGDGGNGSDAASAFKFKAHGDPNPLPADPGSENQIAKGGNADYQPHLPVKPSSDSAFSSEFPKGHTTTNSEVCSDNVGMVDDANANANNLVRQMCRSDEVSDESYLPKKAIHGEEGDQRDSSHSMGLARTTEDGYNWRKYGQKQVKGSEYPRSYYKCTYPNCQVKKKVERSHDGQITEIIYKGAHNHAKPHPSRRTSLGSVLSTNDISDMSEGSGTCAKNDVGSVWRSIPPTLKDIKHSLDWKADGQERTSSASVVTELSDLVSINQGKSVCNFESEDTPDLSSTLASHCEDEDEATQGSISLEDDADDEESESKRRKKESCLVETNLASRAVREPRVVVQIESEVDILDDGYRWRKYGQKVVKGNPNPRSYYKCTSAGCSVRKHVERASHDLKYVITTYEGKHNHEVPTARNSNQISSSSSVLAGAANSQLPLTLPGNASLAKPETQVHSLGPHFDRKPEFSHEFLRPNFVGSFSNEMKFGSSSLCQMKYSPLNNIMPYGSYGLNTDRCAVPQGGSIASVFPDLPMSLPLNIPPSGNFPLPGLSYNCVKPMGRVQVQSFISGQQLKDIDKGLLRPKQEQKDDNVYDSCMPIVDQANASSSLYHSVMQNFPS
ncbi:hypothetical protein L6164_010676 [Bauhinia variegata]|uniref:Uncharacterized protein n=1 Tax=Bauhinia variegata TaxID=167791 RepID=A0ACB9PNR3_BAUVA|nr:hypothetical protein L6164_010676 [Bauhinia variegata]